MRGVKDVFGLVALAAAISLPGLPFSEARLEIIPPNSKDKEIRIDELQPITYAMPPDDGAMGKLVVAKPVNACSPIQSVPYPSKDSFSWFVLVRRYDCNFAAKLRNAQRAGYSGVIIYDFEGPDLSFTRMPRPYGYGDTRVYAVLVTKHDGALLAQCTYDKDFYIEWFPASSANLLNYLIPCIVIILFCILLIACLVVVQQCTRWFRERRRNAKYRLARKYLKQLPIKRWAKGEEFKNYEVCSICLDEYQEGDKLRVLPCLHGYHARCIDPWLTKNRRVCPLCKRKIVLPGMPEDSSDDETAPLLGTRQESSGGTFRPSEPSNQTVQIEVHPNVESEPQLSAVGRVMAPGGLYSVNDEVEVLPRPRRNKKRKRLRRPREPLDDITVAGPSGSTDSGALASAPQAVTVRLAEDVAGKRRAADKVYAGDNITMMLFRFLRRQDDCM
ncbi:E3 ubiquitin-protein ligase RNF13-like [Varroa jacobsoni]|uniref:RING-type E3 ubiquitin transferase n=1 Tax=Varroa destructor TaxID=109461 RepID=A0A7M7KSH2_VARDE|nr:E3 ubiquitin-protein ligase RNF13-like isoform X2 [Varroa destructor]XP_022700349.1 E3 ubiquitin-protein ligase RNF13-like [Varroa jacobsoni]